MPEQWDVTDLGLTRTFEFKGFRKVQAFVTEVMNQAAGNNHHPVVTFSYKAVSVTYITHDAGNKITQLDVDSAEILDNIYKTM